MKVKELREYLKKYSDKEKENIIVELYKMIPKVVKDSKDVDNYLKDATKKEDKHQANVEFSPDLIKELDYFIKCANEGLYASPNKVISKKERSNWRFKVMRFYKALCSVPIKSKNGALATEYLRLLYHLLCVGTETLVFTNWDTFRAIRISQHEYLNCLLKRELAYGYNEADLIKSIKICMYPADRDSLSSDALEFLFDMISDKKTQVFLIKLVQKEIDEYKKYNESYKVFFYAESVAYMYLNLHMVNEAISYLSKFDDEEICFYIIFDILKKIEYYEEWIEVYEKYKDKIKYRDSINNDYNRIKVII